MSIYDKPSKEMLLDAINRQNGLTANPLTWEQVATGFPESVQTPGADRKTVCSIVVSLTMPVEHLYPRFSV